MIRPARERRNRAAPKPEDEVGSPRLSTGTWVLAATILGTIMAFVDGFVVNVAIPVLQVDLKANVSDLQWVVDAYALPLGALTVLGGSLGDRYGRRAVFTTGVVVFAVSSAACGLAASAGELIVARAVQGAGAALLVPGSLSIIGSFFTAGDRARAIGTWSGLTSIATALGPVVGGWLVEHISWRAAFFLNVPIAVAVVAISIWRVPESRAARGGGRLDWPGAVTATAGLGILVYGLIRSSEPSADNTTVLASVASGLALLALFVFVEARAESPMLPLNLFRSTDFSGANLLTLLLYAALGGVLFFLPINLIQVQGYSPTAAGAAFLPFILIMFALGRWSGGLVERYGARRPLTIGPSVAGAGLGMLAVPDIGGSYWATFFPGMVLLGLGMAITVAPLTTTVLGAVGSDDVGVASGINNSVARVAGLLAIAALGVVVVGTFNTDFHRGVASIDLPAGEKRALESQQSRLAAIVPPAGISGENQSEVKTIVDEAYVDGYRKAMLIAAGLAFAAAVSAALLVHDSPRGGGRRPGGPGG
ncbi:MAG TPA: MFS transporter [Chloroflexota bacterium]